MTTSQQIARRNFSAKTLRVLSQRGIEVVSVQMLPGDGDMPWANADLGFLVQHEGCGKVWTFRQVLAAAQ